MPPVAKAQQFIAPVLFTRYFFLRDNHRVKKRTFDLRYHTLKVQWKSIESSSAVACRSLSRKSPSLIQFAFPFFTCIFYFVRQSIDESRSRTDSSLRIVTSY